MSTRQPTRGPKRGVSRIAPRDGGVDRRSGAGEAYLPPRAKRLVEPEDLAERPPSPPPIHPTSGKYHSRNFALRGFSEVRQEDSKDSPYMGDALCSLEVLRSLLRIGAGVSNLSFSAPLQKGVGG